MIPVCCIHFKRKGKTSYLVQALQIREGRLDYFKRSSLPLNVTGVPPEGGEGGGGVPDPSYYAG